MREREVGGYEPDETEQRELVELWHLSRGAASFTPALLAQHGTTRGVQIAWIVDAYLKEHQGEPNVARKWIYVWCEANLGHYTTPATCCTYHATGGGVSVCSKKRHTPSAEERKPRRISDVVSRDDLKICTKCKLPRLMHGTPMTDCEHMTPRS